MLILEGAKEKVTEKAMSNWQGRGRWKVSRESLTELVENTRVNYVGRPGLQKDR